MHACISSSRGHTLREVVFLEDSVVKRVTARREKEKKLYNNLRRHYARNYQMMPDGHVADMGLKYACN